MTKVIYKYTFSNNKANFTLIMPKGAKILTVQLQKFRGEYDGTPCIWALVDSKAETETRSFQIIGTGIFDYFSEAHPKKYIGTYQLNNIGIVHHVFELL